MNTLRVPDMSCEHCVKRISDALSEAGLDFRVDLATHSVSLSGKDEQVQRAITALEDIGYQATIA